MDKESKQKQKKPNGLFLLLLFAWAYFTPDDTVESKLVKKRKDF